jgi:hypothetical protein
VAAVSDAPRKLTPEQARDLHPFLEAGRRGLAAAKWRVGMDADDLVAPIVLAVIAEVTRRVLAGETLTALQTLHHHSQEDQNRHA